MKMLKMYKIIDYSPKNGNIDEKMIIIVILKQKSGRKKIDEPVFVF